MAAATAFVTLVNATAARAQSCAMCYNTAAAAKAAAIQALRSGILILLVPVALMFIGIFVLAFRSKERLTGPSPEQIDYNQELSNWIESLPPEGPHAEPLFRGDRGESDRRNCLLPLGEEVIGGYRGEAACLPAVRSKNDDWLAS